MPHNLLETKEDFVECLKNNSLVVVMFFSVCCGPSLMFRAKFDDMAKEYSDVKFVKVDVHENDETTIACDINRTPTFHTYKDGSKVAEDAGASQDKLKKLIDDLKAGIRGRKYE